MRAHINKKLMKAWIRALYSRMRAYMNKGLTGSFSEAVNQNGQVACNKHKQKFEGGGWMHDGGDGIPQRGCPDLVLASLRTPSPAGLARPG